MGDACDNLSSTSTSTVIVNTNTPASNSTSTPTSSATIIVHSDNSKKSEATENSVTTKINPLPKIQLTVSGAQKLFPNVYQAKVGEKISLNVFHESDFSSVRNFANQLPEKNSPIKQKWDFGDDADHGEDTFKSSSSVTYTEPNTDGYDVKVKTYNSNGTVDIKKIKIIVTP